MLATLSPRQRRVLISLGLANLILLIVIGAFIFSPEPEPIPTSTTILPDTAPICQSAAASALAEHGVAGTITIRGDGSIDFVISGDDPADAWDAFAVSAELPEQSCGPYDPIRLDVSDPSLAPNHRLVVEARWDDVKAWSLGQIDDEALSERTHRSTYVRQPSPTQP